MKERQGGWLVAKTLYDLGVRNIFTLGGGHINPIFVACSELEINLIDTHHEQGASMAADAYGRITKKPGICLVTAGPGFTNTLTGVAGSFLSNSPLLLIAGMSGLEENDRVSLQEIDQEAMITPITKWAKTVYDTNRIPEYVSRAFMIAQTGKPGPVYLGMSYEILYPFLDKSKEKRIKPITLKTTTEPSDKTVEQVVSLIEASTKPVVIAGSGCWYSGAERLLFEFSLLFKIPLFTLNMGRGIVSDDRCFGIASPGSPRGFKDITALCDLIILLGVRPSIYMGFGKTFNPKAKIIQVDIDPKEIGKNIEIELPIVTDASGFLKRTIHALKGLPNIERRFEDWYKEASSISQRTYREFETRYLRKKKCPIHPALVAKTVSDLLSQEGIIVVDGGDCQSWCDITCEVKGPGRYLKGGPLGCMGIGIPFALGAKVAEPQTPVVLISGDGAAAMNFMEIETAVRHSLPFTVVICNDSAWGMTKHQMNITYPDLPSPPGVDIGFIPFHKIAESMGGYGELVEKPKDLKPALKRALSSGLPSVINVKTDPDAISGATHTITSMMMSKMK